MTSFLASSQPPPPLPGFVSVGGAGGAFLTDTHSLVRQGLNIPLYSINLVRLPCYIFLPATLRRHTCYQ